ncbi:MAG TPA: TetR family transcriptional regulator [Acidimicrobiales bacterium]|jgi:AcrR family transcriptional regulator|nr:TetR family transcriptional regulator [Acidimicrobiales bacterium]
MGRWEPDARGRLEKAAMELYVERGFEETTVAEIAKRAGLTERTFFRHFADKREVLFAGAAMLHEVLVRTVDDAPPDLAPVDAAMAGVVAGGALIQERRAFARRRYEIIAANAELQERELIKLASLSAAAADALRRRGVADHAASLAAEVAIAVFRVAFERWVADPVHLDLPALMGASLDELRTVTADSGAGRPGATAAS